MSNARPSSLLPHKDRILALFRAGESMRGIAKEFGCSPSVVRWFLMQQIPVEYEAIQHKRWGSKRMHRNRIEKPVQIGSREQCFNLPSCTCHNCKKFRQDPPLQVARYDIYRAWADGTVRS